MAIQFDPLLNKIKSATFKRIAFKTSYTKTGDEPTGTIYWDSGNRTYSAVLENGVIGQLFKEAFIDGQNDTGVTINNGTPVAYQGSIGNSGNFRIKKAQALSTEPAFYFIGLVTEDVDDGEVGKITTRGKVRGIQTDGVNYGESWSDGDILYVSGDTAGYLTNTPPGAPIPAIPVALVVSAHESNGTLEVRPTYPQSLSMLSDVDGTLSANGQMMYWNQTAGYFDFTPTDGMIYDFANKRLGIGTATPSTRLEVRDTTNPQVTISYDGTYNTTLGTNASGYFGILPSGKQMNLNVGADSTGVTDFLINPTTKTSGNLFDLQVNGSSRLYVNYTGRIVTFSTSQHSFQGGIYFNTSNAPISTVGALKFNASGGQASYLNKYTFTLDINQTNSSGMYNFFSIKNQLNQSGTAGATDLLINRTETAVGSGAQLLFDAQVGGISKLKIATDNTITQSYDATYNTILNTNATGYFGILPSGKQMNLNVGADSSGAIDFLINPTTKSSGHFCKMQVNGSDYFAFSKNTLSVAAATTIAYPSTNSYIVFAGGISDVYGSTLKLHGWNYSAFRGGFLLAGSIGGQDQDPADSSISGTDAASTASTNLVGGDLTIKAGNGASGSSGLANGGNLILAGGTGYGTGVLGGVKFGAVDSQKTFWGAGADMSMYYDGTDGYIKTSEVAASDLHITTGTDKTVVYDTPIWDDLNFDVARSGGPVASQPDFVVINNVVHREFTSANNQFCGASQELPHHYKLSSTLYPHVHLFLKSGESAGTTGVTFTFYWELRQSTGTTSGSVTLSATSAELGTTAGGNKFNVYDATGFSGSAELGGQLACTISRTGGDAGDVVISTYGVHYQKDTPGSRTVSTK